MNGSARRPRPPSPARARSRSGHGPLMNTPVGRLSDDQWGWIVTAAIFGWIETRVQQAIAEGLDQEQTVRLTGLSPSPCDVAVVRSILPTLADTAGIDWTQPLAAWSKDTMSDFLLMAWELIRKAEIARDHGPGGILRNQPFARSGDPSPFLTVPSQFVLTLQPLPGVDAIRSLRWVLKGLLRQYGMRCVDLYEENPSECGTGFQSSQPLRAADQCSDQ